MSSASKNDSEASPAAASNHLPLLLVVKARNVVEAEGKKGDAAAAATTAIDVEEGAGIIAVPKEDDSSLPRPQDCS